MYRHLIYARCVCVDTRSCALVEKRGVGDGRVNRAGGLFRAYVSIVFVNVCTRAWVLRVHAREVED